MENGYKEALSAHVKNIFKKYRNHGLHICDLATGGGKSYTIGELTCTYYPNFFDKIIILCVQNKLIDAMNRDIDQFIESDNSLIKYNDKIVIENNIEVISKAIKEESLNSLLNDMELQIDRLSFGTPKKINIKSLKTKYHEVVQTSYELRKVCDDYDNNIFSNELVNKEINNKESILRNLIKHFLIDYKAAYLKAYNKKDIPHAQLLKLFPNLIKVYPQIEYKHKKVILMTVHKAMWGLDPILDETINLSNFADPNKRTLILFDESDLAATAMRSVIIDQAIEKNGGAKRFSSGYIGFLQYQELIEAWDQISTSYHHRLLDRAIASATKVVNARWKTLFGNIKPYKNIHLINPNELEDFRHGVFFCGPTMRLNIYNGKDNPYSYICYQKGTREFKLVHEKDSECLKKQYERVIPLDIFMNLISRNLNTIKSELAKVIRESLEQSRQKYNQAINDVANNNVTTHQYLNYPTLDREIHTLFSRFETMAEQQYERQLKEFIVNRKNLIFSSKNSVEKFPDYSVYTQGFQLFQEEIDNKDNHRRVRLGCREITTTPEKILLDLINTPNTSVVLCSATSSGKSVISNFDINYLQQAVGEKIFYISKSDRLFFDELVEKTYPTNHHVHVVPIEKLNIEEVKPGRAMLPNKYRKMFSENAIQSGIVDSWFFLTLADLTKRSNGNEPQIRFELYKLFQFIEAYYWFIKHDDIHSMLYFQNRSGEKDKKQINIISSLIDGTYQYMKESWADELPTNWENPHIRISKNWKEVECEILPLLSNNNKEKIMLVSAYGSFKAGANMQYDIPEGLEVLIGDNWVSKKGRLQKDWDAVYLQSPTAYLMINDSELDPVNEKSLYNVMLSLMMLYERGCLSMKDVSHWLIEALSGRFMFGTGNNLGIISDKSDWALTIIEQAVGRLCRTRNKPYTTYILYDNSMSEYFKYSKQEKSLTKEFKALKNYIINLNHTNKQVPDESVEEIQNCNLANESHKKLALIRKIALTYTTSSDNDDDDCCYDDDDEKEEISSYIKVHQQMNQTYKQTIIRKPVLTDLAELNQDDRKLTFIQKCYGKWNRNKDNGYYFYYNKDNNIAPKDAEGSKMYPTPVSPKSVRLDVLMKNPIIKKYFENNGYATDWKEGDYILHPEILLNDYAGEIGEEAFIALVLHYTNCTECNIKHLEEKDYELADFIICDANGKYRIAFDVKNMRPDSPHYDNPNDKSTTDKRRYKLKRLGCELVTVNMLKLFDSTVDSTHEIDGLLDEQGNIIPENLRTLIKLINK